ncbi:hypothetical protein CBP31_13465 [Oceanisphaera profunda]|uniref:Yip1 domain-containing protein n=1 Tax=Oceanisphaera profunda TaxID=1416627 RepID=A0A1Y0D7J1_9GAMM|nr:Yip1 family protein [Oceanisphaera profunda]ART83509.1 hypothetical protein CBP31_13465 [Oceanisphaera profunda]
MFLNRIWGLYTQPKVQWHTVDRQHESLRYSLIHLAVIALIPTICAYLSTTMIGWNFGTTNSTNILLTPQSALAMAISMYVGLIFGVFALAYLIFWMASTFGAKPSFANSIELAAYTATPLFMAGFALFYPEPIVIMVVGLLGVAYSVYLLYTGIPIVMRIPEDRGFIYASSVITAALVLLVCLMTATVLIWSWGFGPMYMN